MSLGYRSCSRCGWGNGFYINVATRGPATEAYDNSGNYVESSVGPVTHYRHRVVRCGGCGLPRRDLEYIGGRVAAKKPILQVGK